MSDMIERLRNVAEPGWAGISNGLCYEAADEIERLRAALRKICSTEKRLTNHGYEIARQALEDDE